MSSAPGNAVARLLAVRVVTESGESALAVDIRRPVGVEVRFAVLESGHRLSPNLFFYNDDGTCLFYTVEVESPWRHQARPCGVYRATAWIPGNLLAEGSVYVAAAVSTIDPAIVHVHEPNAVAFHVVDSVAGDSERGDYGGRVPGLMRPKLRWESTFQGPFS
jgi:lipopolysaccharide transport system ATP-binding protein